MNLSMVAVIAPALDELDLSDICTVPEPTEERTRQQQAGAGQQLMRPDRAQAACRLTIGCMSVECMTIEALGLLGERIPLADAPRRTA